MTDELFVMNCGRCYHKTPHEVYAVSRKRGYKLRCIKCGRLHLRYTKNPIPYDDFVKKEGIIP